MGFNFGAFGSGMSEGIQTGSTLADQQLSRQLKNQQLQEYLNAQAAQRAFTNVSIPGANAMPGTPQQPGSGTPTLAQLPIVGPLVRGAQSAGNAFSDFFGGGPSDGSMSPPPGQTQVAATPPAPIRNENFDPANTPPVTDASYQLPGMQARAVVAQAMDRANPGLRQSNPQVFAQAVQLGVDHVQKQLGNEAAIAKQNAEVGHLGAQTEAEKSKVPLNESHAKLYEERSKYGPYGRTQQDQINKDITTQINQSSVQLRHYENQKTRLLQSPVMTPEIQRQIVDANNHIQYYQNHLGILQKQQPDYTPPAAATPAPVTPNISAPKQAELKPVIDKMVGLGGDPVQTTNFVKYLQAKGVPQEEINYVLMTTKNRLTNPNIGNTASGGTGSGPKIRDSLYSEQSPTIPMSR